MSARRGGRGNKRPYYDNVNDYYGGRSASATFEDKEPLNEVKRDAVIEIKYRDKTDEFIAFDSQFVRAMLSNVKVLTIGDSLMRGLYKDLVTWLNSENLISDQEIKARSEPSFRGDRQIDCSLLTDDKVFRQAREYQTENFMIQFMFTTRVMKDDMDTLIQQMLGVDGYPDVILLNSMIWDLTRYFKVSTDTSYSDSQYQKKIEIEALQKYLDRTAMLLRRFRAILPPHTMVVWICFPHCRPSLSTRGIQAIPLASERNHFIRSVMIDGSFRVAQLVRSAGYDVLDIGFYMRNHAFYHYQKDDGMHWLPSGVRLMSQLVLQFLAKSWGIDTSKYLSNLEDKQQPDQVKTAMDQLKTHDYHFPDITKLHARIAQATFRNMDESQKNAVRSLLEKARTICPFVQPPFRETKRNPVYNSYNRTSEFIEQVRMVPHIDREAAHTVEELAEEMLSVTRIDV